MSAIDSLCLNRIIKPQIPLEEFLKFTTDLGIKYVEVRNDFTDKGILDGLSDAALQKAFKDTGVKALTINALYPFEDAKVLKDRAVDSSGVICRLRSTGSAAFQCVRFCSPVSRGHGLHLSLTRLFAQRRVYIRNSRANCFGCGNELNWQQD